MNTTKKTVAGLGLAALLLGGGLAAGAVTAASAATPTPSASSDTDSAGDRDPSQGGHVGTDGTVETVLTGTDLATATAAVEAAYPDVTIERIENDAEGASAYEAHVVQADGTDVHVMLDASFTVTGITTGH